MRPDGASGVADGGLEDHKRDRVMCPLRLPGSARATVRATELIRLAGDFELQAICGPDACGGASVPSRSVEVLTPNAVKAILRHGDCLERTMFADSDFAGNF